MSISFLVAMLCTANPPKGFQHPTHRCRSIWSPMSHSAIRLTWTPSQPHGEAIEQGRRAGGRTGEAAAGGARGGARRTMHFLHVMQKQTGSAHSTPLTM